MKHNFKKAASAFVAAAMVLGSVQSAFAGTYVVQKGDYLSKIAPKYKTTWQKLAEMNKLKNPNLIFPNQVLHRVLPRCLLLSLNRYKRDVTFYFAPFAKPFSSSLISLINSLRRDGSFFAASTNCCTSAAHTSRSSFTTI